MKKVMEKIYRGIFSIAMIASTVFVNATCSNKLYQEKLPDELDKLRKND